MKPGSRTLIVTTLVVVAAVVVELANRALSDNLVIVLLGAPGILAGRHALPELAPLFGRRPPIGP